MVYDAVTRHRGGVMSMDSFRQSINATLGPGSTPSTVANSGEFFFPIQLPTVKELEASLISEALKRANNNQTIAAQLVGLTRSALNKRLNRTA